MMSISLCMILKNEEDVLARCLDCVKDLVDEIILVDTGSSDATLSVAEKYTDLIYHFPWIDDFAAARNFSFSKATKDFVMWLDADDVLSEENREGFRKLKESLNNDVDMVMMNYDVAFDAMGRPTFSYNRERILRREKAYRWQGVIHEVIVPSGNILYSPVSVSHKKLHPTDPDRNLKIFEKVLAEVGELEPRQQFYYARELSYHGRYQEAVAVLSAFLDAGKGWVENNINACVDLAGYYRATGQPDMVLPALCRSFAYDRPRAEVCCELGGYFLEKSQYAPAIFWYETAASTRFVKGSGGFQQPDCYGFIPYMQLCVCYDKVGDSKKSLQCHYKAKKLKPDDARVLYNEKYFKTLKGR